MDDLRLKHEIFCRLESIAGCLGSATRLRILFLLCQGPLSVENLSTEIGTTMPNVSQHLRRLEQGRLVKVTPQGTKRIYSVSSARVQQLWEALEVLSLEIDPEIREYERRLQKSENDATVDLEGVAELLKQGSACLLDVRPLSEAAYSGLEGAYRIPFDELEEAFTSLPKEKTIFVYCRGRFCRRAEDAVIFLKGQGICAYRVVGTPFSMNILATSA